MKLTRGRLEELFERFRGLRILVVGDFFLDKYLHLDRRLSEVSLETGLEAYQVVRVRTLPGAAGTVAKDLAALGVNNVVALSLIGPDGEGYELVKALQAFGVDVSWLIKASGRRTPTYMKPIMRELDGREHELNRIDIKNRTPMPPELEKTVILYLQKLIPEVQGVAIVDQVEEQDCGVVTKKVREEIEHLAATFPDKIFIADSRARIGLFRGMIVKPNRREAATAFGLDLQDVLKNREKLLALGARLREQTGKPVYITASDEGVYVFHEKGYAHVPAVRVEGPIDPVGAGDAVMAALIAALCARANVIEAAEFAMLCAAITLRKLGTTGEATPEEVLSLFEELTRQSRDR